MKESKFNVGDIVYHITKESQHMVITGEEKGCCYPCEWINKKGNRKQENIHSSRLKKYKKRKSKISFPFE